VTSTPDKPAAEAVVDATEDGHGHAHGHSHVHDHSLFGGWEDWRNDKTLRVVLAGILCAGIATIIGVVALWPTGEGRDEAIEKADEIGLVTERFSATVTGVVDQQCSYANAANPQECRVVTTIVHDGHEPGATVVLPEINLEFASSVPEFSEDDAIILGYEESTDFYFYADKDRRPSLVWLAVMFAVFVIALSRFRGVLALFAMAATLVVLVAFVAPSVLDGHDPLLVSVVAASAIAFISLYLTHGFTPTTTVALAGTLVSLALTLALSWFFFEAAQFTGLASEEALILPFIAENLNVSALLLGGAVIGGLGALDDVTVTQVATVAELRRRSPDLPGSELIVSGIRVGRDHIASTVNTLLLAYTGASMPLIMLFAVSNQPLEMVANSELIAVEIVRTLCGSIGLVAAVPITTILAAAVLGPGQMSAAVAASPLPHPHGESSPTVEETEHAPAPAEPQWSDFGPAEQKDW